MRRSLLWLLLLAGAPAMAQGSGVIVGIVRDAATKNPINEVVVTATSPILQGEQVVVTDATGLYRIPGLRPGKYDLRFEKDGYKPFSRDGLPIRQDVTVRVNVELLPESITEDIVVVPAPPTIDVGSDPGGVRVSSDFIKNVPLSLPTGRGLAARSWESLVEPGPADTYGVNDQGDGRHQRMSPVNGKRYGDMYFQNYGVNPTIETAEERFSTFSVDVDTASYAVARAYLDRGSLPDKDAVRVEEFVNSFDYQYEPPTDAPFTLHVEAFPSPNRLGYHLLHVGLKAKEVKREDRLPASLVFVIDVSGSMDVEDRLGLVKRALRVLVEQLDDRDRVGIVVYGSEAHVVLGSTPATQADRILAAIDALRPEGSTNAQAGITLGYQLATESFRAFGTNRIVLCSDGVANNGITSADGIFAQVKQRAAAGITLSTVGFGMGNFNDVLMERLAQLGGGNYAYVDRIEEAQRIFVQNLTGTLQVVARDVKIQLEFDPAVVARYRLIGYENRHLEKEQFADDRVDAGEVGAGHAVTALYEVKLKQPGADLGTVRVRYKVPGEMALATPKPVFDGPTGYRFVNRPIEVAESRLIEKRIPAGIVRDAYAAASSPARLSFVVAAFAEKLRESYWVRNLSWGALRARWAELPEPVRARREVAELGSLIERAGGFDKRRDRFEAVAPVAAMDFDRVPVLP